MPPACSSSPSLCFNETPHAPAAGCVDSGATSTSEQTTSAAELSGTKRWYSILESMEEGLGPQAVQQLLEDAVHAAQKDLQWAHSGILELLSRAKDSAADGFVDSARKCALGLLDFHVVVERYRQAVSSGSEGKRSTSGVDSSSGEEEPSQVDVSTTTTHVPWSARVPAPVKAGKREAEQVSSGPRRKRSCCSADSAQTTTTSASSGPHRQSQLLREPLAAWAGPVKLLMPSGDCVEFCRLSMQVPSPLLADLPSELVVTSIRHRRGLATKGQLSCSTSITADAKQMVDLRKMANLELVALVPLGDCGAIFVPYMTDAGHVKAVTFLVALA